MTRVENSLFKVQVCFESSSRLNNRLKPVRNAVFEKCPQKNQYETPTKSAILIKVPSKDGQSMSSLHRIHGAFVTFHLIEFRMKTFRPNSPTENK